MPLEADPSGMRSRASSTGSGRGSSPAKPRHVPPAASIARLLRESSCRRVHIGSIPLLAPLLGDRLVILADQPVVARHERLRVRVGVHLRPQRLGQVAPNVLVRLLVRVAVALLPLAGTLALVALSAHRLWRLWLPPLVSCPPPRAPPRPPRRLPPP